MWCLCIRRSRSRSKCRRSREVTTSRCFYLPTASLPTGDPSTMARLIDDRYGKARVRLVRVRRLTSQHELVDWTLSILFRGDFEKCFTDGDNSMILPTDTMKNTVYSLARRSEARSIEEFATELCKFFLDRNPRTTEVSVEITERSWTPARVGGNPHPTTFVQSDQEVQTISIVLYRSGQMKVEG